MAIPVELNPFPTALGEDVKGNKSCLFEHQLVDTSFDALKFCAAASYQLPSAHLDNCKHGKCDTSKPLLVVSPYTSPSHLLDLSRISEPNQLLAKALTTMKPLRSDYATAPYTEAFNWKEVMDTLQWLIRKENYKWKETSFYVVVFQSRVPPTTDKSHLGTLDEKSHEEAMESGGLLK